MRIIILSRNPSLYSTQSLVRACYKRNHWVRVVDHLSCDLVIEGRSFDIYYRGSKLPKVDAIIPRVSSSVTHESTMVIRHFEANQIYTLARSEAVLRTKDKFRSLQHMAAGGVRIPKSMVVNHTWFDQRWVATQFDFPAVLKLLEGTHGQGVVLADSVYELQNKVQAYAANRYRSMVQEFIEESSGKDIRAFVVGDHVIASMLREAADGDFRSNLHAGGRGRPIALSEEERLQAIKAAKIMGLGVAGVDLLRTSSGSYVLEVNASPGLEGIETITGVNVASAIVRYLEKQVKKFNKHR